MDLSKKKILILGGSSHAGRSMCEYLIKKNKNINLLATYNSNIDFLNKLKIKKKKIKIFKINLISDVKKLIKIINREKPNFIIDFASDCNVQESWHKTENIFLINLISKIKIVKFLIKKKFLEKYIYISTPEIFGSNKKKIKEYDRYFNPTSPYATSKLSCELVMRNFHKSYHFPLVICRFANFYGKLQERHRLMPAIIDSIKRKRIFYLQGSGDYIRSFINEEDFCKSIDAVIKKSKIGEIYHFSGKKFYQIKYLVLKIFDIFGFNSNNYLKRTKARISQDKIYKLSDILSRKKLKIKDTYEILKDIKKIF